MAGFERISAWLLATDARIPLSCEWAYDHNDPWAVQVTFLIDPPVVWTFARTLLIDGLTAASPVGLGDVKVCRDGRHFLLRVRSPHGAALVAMDPTDVGRFLDWTYGQCPLTAEPDHAGIDAELRQIIGESS